MANLISEILEISVFKIGFKNKANSKTEYLYFCIIFKNKIEIIC